MVIKMKKNNFLKEYIRKQTLEAFVGSDKKHIKTHEWKNFLESLPKSKDPFVISQNKYKSRRHYFDTKYKIIINLVAMFELLGIHFSNFLNKVLKRNKDDLYIAKDKQEFDMIIFARTFGFEDVFPEELYEEFPKYKVEETTHERTLIFNKELKNAYKEFARRNRFNFHHKVLALREFALHSYILENYNPKATVVYVNERNTLGAIIRDIYEKNNKEFIGFMHGTDLWQLTKAFMSFSRYYIWDKDYIDMYENDSYCNIGKYIVYRPIKNRHVFDFDKKYSKDITYYLSGQTESAQIKLANIMKELHKKGIKLVVRKHPRHEIDSSIYLKGNIEDSSTDIYNSMNETEYIAGTSTTVIEQGYYGGKKILIDDVTNEQVFDDLKTRKYLMLKKIGEDNVELFSDYLKKYSL